MDINSILFIIAVLNLLGDLYNILKLRHQLPTWIPLANLAALASCAVAWLITPHERGMIAIGILVLYIVAIKVYSQKRTRALSRIPSPITKALIGANVIAFVIQLSLHATDTPYALVSVGALYSPLVEQGEWWRFISAQFVHWGAAHLLFNCMGLWFLGPLVEDALGFLRYVLTYLACGVGGMLIAWGVATYLSADPHPIVLLGASASVLGLVGVQAAFALRMFRTTGSPWAKAQLNSMVQIIVLQAIFDFMVPQVSSTAHVGGAATGFALGMLALRPHRR